MGLFDLVFGKRIEQAVVERVGNLYNRNIYQWLNNGQPVYFDDRAHTFIDEGYMSIGAVYECVDLILNKIAACPVVVYEVKDEQKLKKYNNLMQGNIEQKAQAMMLKAQVLNEVQIDRIQRLIDKPNPYQNYTAFIKQLAGFYLLTGNSYLYTNGPNPANKVWTEMFVLPANNTTIISGGMMEPVLGYILKTNPDNAYRFPAEQVAHMKTFNPAFDTTGSQLYGMSQLRAYLKTLARVKAGDKEINKQLNNGGAFGLLSPKNAQDILSAEQKQSLKERLIMAKDATDSLARIFPATIAMEWQQIGLPYADMKLAEMLQAADEAIYRAYHVPLQFRSTDSATFNNQAVAGKQLIYNAVQPVIQELDNTLTYALCNQFKDKKYIIRHDTSSLPEMSEDMEKVAQWLEKSYDLTLNERREVKGWGRLDLPNMDIPLVPKNLTPVDMVGLDTGAFDRTLNDNTQ